MKYMYKSEICTFFIVPNNSDRYDLLVKEKSGIEDKLGSYHTPTSAADDVYMCETGYHPWDNQFDVDEPASLEDWIKIK